jgi:hypothetical protein
VGIKVQVKSSAKQDLVHRMEYFRLKQKKGAATPSIKIVKIH